MLLLLLVVVDEVGLVVDEVGLVVDEVGLVADELVCVELLLLLDGKVEVGRVLSKKRKSLGPRHWVKKLMDATLLKFYNRHYFFASRYLVLDALVLVELEVLLLEDSVCDVELSKKSKR